MAVIEHSGYSGRFETWVRCTRMQEETTLRVYNRSKQYAIDDNAGDDCEDTNDAREE